ncbi:hypothetical protein LVY72_03010 [Arthrobacter sp. I2-34]|uniref:Uncharacterized protein n=1 Tax=Arthrobacter hankyongi TaxID=2904801 RepID=A0ABS9L2J3_9MICC|nr:hypothetical protein [Arthrobacter hankyongi]MCG2620881.1 hypothetical protein [Arthrobacter hankyongi]
MVAIAGSGVAGSVVNYAGVLASFDVPADCTTLSAVAPVSVNWYAWVWAWAGYASAESLVILRLYDGSDLLEDRWSLDYLYTVVVGGKNTGDMTTQIPLSVSLTRTSQVPTTGKVGVFVEAWSGAGGVSGAGSKSSTVVSAITVSGT